MRWDTSAYRNRIRRGLKTLQRVKTWQLFVIGMIALVVAVMFLRLNSLNMIDYRQTTDGGFSR